MGAQGGRQIEEQKRENRTCHVAWWYERGLRGQARRAAWAARAEKWTWRQQIVNPTFFLYSDEQPGAENCGKIITHENWWAKQARRGHGMCGRTWFANWKTVCCEQVCGRRMTALKPRSHSVMNVNGDAVALFFRQNIYVKILATYDNYSVCVTWPCENPSIEEISTWPYAIINVQPNWKLDYARQDTQQIRMTLYIDDQQPSENTKVKAVSWVFMKSHWRKGNGIGVESWTCHSTI